MQILKLFNTVTISCVGLFLLTVFTWAQVDVMVGTYGRGVYPRSERVIDELQSAMIYNMFTKPMLAVNEVIKDDDEDEDNWLTSKQSQEFMNDLLARTLADELARQDMLKLKEPLKKQLRY